jgi:hypothetical protein
MVKKLPEERAEITEEKAVLAEKSAETAKKNVDTTGKSAEIAKKSVDTTEKSAETVEGEAAVEDEYTGSEACKECHQDTYEGWENTLHSKLVQDVKKNPALLKGDFSKPVAKKYSDKYEVTNSVGAHWMQRYLTKIKDDHYVLPITWSLVTRTWSEQKSLKRTWKKKKNSYSRKCIGCHTTNYNPDDKSYTEHQVGCESCHGPGRAHIDKGGDIAFIVNPKKLPDNLSDMVCAACHVKAEDKTLKYAFPIGFKPGDNLADYLSVRTLGKVGDETPEDLILREFDHWKEMRDSPRSCDVCGVEKPSEVPVHLLEATADSPDFCFSCHDFKEKIVEHTRHYGNINMKCNDCHKRINGGGEEEKDDKRNIHSYGFYMIHKTGCYDPFIEKSCVNCHTEKSLGWATSYVIDWAVPANFAVHEKETKYENENEKEK